MNPAIQAMLAFTLGHSGTSNVRARSPEVTMSEEDAFIARAQAVLSAVRFMDYQFTVRRAHVGLILQAGYMEPDVYAPNQPAQLQLTRKWPLSPYMTNSELVSTAFKCCITSMEHRAREQFTYRGARVYGPHFDVEDLVRLCLVEQREAAGGRDDPLGRT